jgi:hypothetical protein
MIGNGQRVAVVMIAQQELALEIRVPELVGVSKPCFDGEFDCGYRCVSSGSGASLGAVRRNFMSPSPVALPARFLKKSAAVSTTPTFSATAAAIHWFSDTPSSFASRWAAFLMERGSFNG